MSNPVGQLRGAFERFDREGTFTDADYDVLRQTLSRVAGPRAAALDLLDGLVNLFFERHLMEDRRRAELLALPDDDLLRAVRHRFRQVIADDRPDQQPYHALRAHVRDVLDATADVELPPSDVTWPVAIRTRDRFDRAAVEQAVCALWRELQSRPTAASATAELLRRYVQAEAEEITSAHDVPEVIRRRLDGQTLAANILSLLTSQERSLLRHVLDEGTVEEWAAETGCSRATAYRLMARLKTLCKLEFAQRSNGTQLEALQALRGRLSAG